MDIAQWERILTLFHETAERPETEREPFLRSRCEDAGLIEDVLAMLKGDARRTSVLDRDLAEVAHAILNAPPPELQSIGPYRILSVLGEGGMGVVYLAEREDLRTRVAIKVLRDAALSRARRERFAREQKMLAHLVHPSIARLFDADTLPDGTPYFVMEYVEGLPLSDYCRRQDCDLIEILRLFRAICEAVHYAHRQAVVHRDLKPSNILVTNDGQVKLVDFGIARHLADLDSPVTQTGFRLMTPAYAAPEQLLGESVNVATDVYALGVVLYELLTGTPPFDVTGRTPGQVEDMILNQEPEKPSLRAPGTIDRRLWGDLDVLCLTAMHKDPLRRYATVEALMRDLDHFLRAEPLEARPESVTYRLQKFMRRHRRRIAAFAVMAGLLVGLVVFYTVRLAAARDAALAESVRTQRIQHFLLNLFEGGDEVAGPADSLRVVTLVEHGVQEARSLESEPEVQAELYLTLGGIFQKLGRLGQADSLLEQALTSRRRLYGTNHPRVAESLIALGLLRSEQARFEEAEDLIREGLRQSRRHLEPGHPALAEALMALAVVRSARGKYDEAVTILEESVRLFSLRSPPGVELSEALSTLADAHFYAGRYPESDSLNRLVMSLYQQRYGRRHPAIAKRLLNLSAARFQLGFYVEAEQLAREALEINRTFYGAEHPLTAANMMTLAQALTFQEKFDEALALLRPALAVRERVYGPLHPRVANTLNELGSVALQQDNLADAETYFARMLSIYDRVYDPKHYLRGIAISNLGSVYLEGKQYDRAASRYREAVELFTEALGDDHVNTAIAHVKLGRALTRSSRFGEAKEHSLAGYEILVNQANPSVSFLRAARLDLATAFEALGDSAQAARFRDELE